MKKKLIFKSFLVLVFTLISLNTVSASEITNEYDSDWGIYTDAQGYNHSQGYSFPEISVADWLPVGTGGHQAYEGYFQIGQTHGNGGSGAGWSQNLICWEGVDWSCVLGVNYDNAEYIGSVGPLPINDYRNVDSVGFFYQYFCISDCDGAGATGYYISAKGRSVSIDSFSAPSQVNVSSSVPISWNTDWATSVVISGITGMSCPQSGSVAVDGSMNCTSNGSAGQATITLTASGPAEGGSVKEVSSSKIIEVVATGAPTTCQDPSATNFNGALPCTYPPASTCSDPSATNFGGALPCTYNTPTTCQDPAATNNGGAAPCTYPTCTDGATAYFTSYPTTLAPGQTGTFTVRVKSTGTAKWYHGDAYRLLQQPSGTTLSIVSTAPANVAGLNYGHLPYEIFQNDTVDWTFTVTAPATPGTYSLNMRMVHTAGWPTRNHSNVLCGSTPNPSLPFGETATATFTVANPAPTVSSVTISSPTVLANGSNQYDITVVGNYTGAGGGSSIIANYARINVQGANSGVERGWLVWSDGDYWPQVKDKRTCTGGSGTNRAGILNASTNPVSSAHGFLNLVSCTTSTSGNTRTTLFKVTFDPSFSTPITNNRISGLVSAGGSNSGYQDLAGFNLVSVPTVENVTISSPTVIANNQEEYTIVVSSSEEVSGSNISQVYARIHNNYGAGNYRGYLTWANVDAWPTEPDRVACNSGYAVIQSLGGNNVYGHQYADLVYCNTTTSGTTRTNTFRVKFKNFPVSPTTGFDIEGVARNTSGFSPWVNFQDLFSVVTPTVPTVISPTVSSITQTSATLGANVTSLGVPASIIARGTCWGTTPAPTTNCIPASGLTTGVFTHSRTSLPAGTTIYYRGYATNSTGTGYSADGSFSTNSNTYTVTVNKTSGGSVTSSPGGINCGGTCASTFSSGATVTLTAVPSSSYWKFDGWSGGTCSGTGPCTFTVSGNVTIGASFSLRSFNYTEF